jgi:hypothetical protein
MSRGIKTGSLLLDQRRTNPKKWEMFRAQCLKAKMHKNWKSNEESSPDFSGLFFIKHKDFVGDIDIAEFYINSKNQKFWMTPGDPTHWSEIETYDYTWNDGTPVYDDEYFG